MHREIASFSGLLREEPAAADSRAPPLSAEYPWSENGAWLTLRWMKTQQACYSRLFTPGPAMDEIALMELACGMRAGGEVQTRLPSGIVYFGQFVDHDITRDETRIADAGKLEPEQTPNYRTPALDLESIYGRGPEAEIQDSSIRPEDYLYDHSKPGAETFRLGSSIPRPGTAEPCIPEADLPRRPDGSAIIAEDRNDENLILAQLTVLFLKFHNQIVDLLDRPTPLMDSVGGDTVFAQARRLVTWHYQYLVLKELLWKVLLEDTFRTVFCSRNYSPTLRFRPARGELPDLPVEFAMAAFRFGHTMVREEYELNSTTTRRTGQLLRRRPIPLWTDEVIDWERFFGRYSFQNVALKIDTKLADALFELPPEIVRLYTEAAPSGPLSLAARTLLRGSRTGLPSGQQAAERAGVAVAEIIPGDRGYTLLQQHGMLDCTPLWYYLLHEATLLGDDVPTTASNRYLGVKLGPLGSLIIAETFLGILEADDDSFWRHGRDWNPPNPRVNYMPNNAGGPITSMARLFHFASAGKLAAN